MLSPSGYRMSSYPSPNTFFATPIADIAFGHPA
jgi:hypothetical protein